MVVYNSARLRLRILRGAHCFFFFSFAEASTAITVGYTKKKGREIIEKCILEEQALAYLVIAQYLGTVTAFLKLVVRK